MGLATHKPFDPADNYEIIYHAPQPRAVLEIVEPTDANKKVEYGKWGRVMLTTLTKETFIPRFLERDEAIRRPAVRPYPWDGGATSAPSVDWPARCLSLRASTEGPTDVANTHPSPRQALRIRRKNPHRPSRHRRARRDGQPGQPRPDHPRHSSRECNPFSNL